MSKRIITCTNCLQEKNNYAKGLCHNCYHQLNVRKLIICSDCGRELPQAAKGLCQTCYAKVRPLVVCNGCGETKPNAANGLCINCLARAGRKERVEYLREYDRQRRAADPEKFKERDKIRRAKPKRKQYQSQNNRERYLLKREEITEKKKTYNKTNRDIFKKAQHTRRARKLGAPINDFTVEQWHDILKQFDNSCFYCGIKDVPLEQEHKIPLSRGGNNTASNIVPSCRPCNTRKNTKTDTEFIEFLKTDPYKIPRRKR